MNSEYEEGRYDKDAEELLLKYPGTQACLVIFAGPASGFSIAALDPIILRDIPRVLRDVAGHIESQTKQQVWKKVII